ncbi:hypothetical protein B0H16DRAFT_1814782 [Mycena metata]|uniref:Uncharacterized protein n=1 Tax=Mycena metata TaxID=1033252 RepID=A0AAD7H4N9_9AGAR|nr:hypothetical protein B0H16DRAFT_1814782 [Mycena metata]
MKTNTMDRKNPGSTSSGRQLPPIQETLAIVYPNASEKERRDIFTSAVEMEGGEKAAIEYFTKSREVLESGVVVGAKRPPSNAVVKAYKVTADLAILYHSTFPAHFQVGDNFMWSFYIADGETLAVNEDWVRDGIIVQIRTLIGGWEASAHCPSLLEGANWTSWLKDLAGGHVPTRPEGGGRHCSPSANVVGICHYSLQDIIYVLARFSPSVLSMIRWAKINVLSGCARVRVVEILRI